MYNCAPTASVCGTVAVSLESTVQMDLRVQLKMKWKMKEAMPESSWAPCLCMRQAGERRDDTFLTIELCSYISHYFSAFEHYQKPQLKLSAQFLNVNFFPIKAAKWLKKGFANRSEIYHYSQSIWYSNPSDCHWHCVGIHRYELFLKFTVSVCNGNS